jgi:nitrogen regulatory protein P-II 2
MTPGPKKLLTIVAEAGLETRLVTMVHAKGAKRHTVSPAHGEGPRGQLAGDISGGNIRLETVVSPEVLALIIQVLEADYFPHYAVSCWVTDVEVIRQERF